MRVSRANATNPANIITIWQASISAGSSKREKKEKRKFHSRRLSLSLRILQQEPKRVMRNLQECSV